MSRVLWKLRNPAYNCLKFNFKPSPQSTSPYAVFVAKHCLPKQILNACARGTCIPRGVNTTLINMSTGGSVKSVTYSEVVQLKNEGNILHIDVRKPSELQKDGKIPKTINIPVDELEVALQVLSSEEFKIKYGIPKPQKNSPIIFSCRSGKRSAAASQIALKAGYTKYEK